MWKFSVLALLILLSFPKPASAEYVELRYAFPQQYGEKEAEGTITLLLVSSEEDQKKEQARLIQEYADIVNSGKYNIHEVITAFRDRYLDLVKLVILPFEGEGNWLHLFIYVRTEGDNPAEKDFRDYMEKALGMKDAHPDMVPMRTSPFLMYLCTQIFYLEPPRRLNPHKVTFDSLTGEVGLDAAFEALHK